MRVKLNGILVLDKPAGMTSARALEQVKRLLRAAKAGHTGTLDPFATGVLVCCLGKATRLSRFFLKGDKTYEGTMRLGLETDTQDATGRVLRRLPVTGLDKVRIEEVFDRFSGRIDQQPPLYAALKHKGVPLYKWARQGKPVQKPPRKVEIFDLKVLAVDLPFIHFQVRCSAGTYVRTLCADIGRSLGCGGLLQSLRRTASSGFVIHEAIGLEELKAVVNTGGPEAVALVPMSEALRGMPMFMADSELAARISDGRQLTRADLSGKSIPVPVAAKYGSFVRIVDDKQRLLAVVKTGKTAWKYDYCCVFHP